MSEELAFAAGIQKADVVNKINSMMIYGPYGSGKTWFASSANQIEDYGPTLIVDVEGSAAGVGRLDPNVDVIKADTHAKLEFILNELLNKDHKYKTVIIDTLNVAQNRAEAHFKSLPENASNKFGAWGDLKVWTLDLMRDLHAADFLGIVIAHSQVDKDENTGRLLTTVNIAGAAKNLLPSIPDIVGYLDYAQDEEGKTISVLRVGRHPSIATKNRFGLGDVLLPAEGAQYPNMVDLSLAIAKANKSAEDSNQE